MTIEEATVNLVSKKNSFTAVSQIFVASFAAPQMRADHSSCLLGHAFTG